MSSWMRLVLVTLAMAGMAFAGVTVSSPTNGSTVGTPTHFVASASSGNPVTAMRIYIDNNSFYTTSSNKIDTYLSMATGSHYVVVVAWDTAGASLVSPGMTVNVSGTASSTGSGVLLFSPTDGATLGSPVHFVASASSSAPVTAMRVYADGNDVFTTNSNSMDTYVNLGAGQHYIVVQAWDSTGKVLQAPPKTITVSGTTTVSSPSAPSNSTVISNVEHMSGWENCTVCAGPGGNGTAVPYSMTQGISNPSMDGNSATFWLGGSTPYSSALWWKQLGANNNAANFVYDLYFYMNAPNYSQALEFDVNQSVGGKKYIFGTQCNYRGTGQWDVWDGVAQTWRPTGVACAVPSAYQWHHLVWEFSRDGSGHANFLAVTLDGVKKYVNRTYSMGGSGVNEINVAFQMDGDYAEHAYQAWLDQIKLTYW
jgi:hypothetical protein